MKRFRFLCLILVLPLILTSCYTQKIFINADKESGTLSIDYTFNDNDFEVISLILSSIPTNGEIGAFDPSVLINQEELAEYFKSLKMGEIQLKKAVITKKNIGKNNNSYTGSIVIDFKNLKQLLEKFPAAENGFRFTKEGNVQTFDQVLDIEKMGDVETLDNYIDLLKEERPQWYTTFIDSTFLIEIMTKTPILASKGVVLSDNNKKASYRFSVKDMLGSNRKKLEFMMKF